MKNSFFFNIGGVACFSSCIKGIHQKSLVHPKSAVTRGCRLAIGLESRTNLT